MPSNDVILPAINVPIIERSTGMCSDAWYRYFETLRNRTGGDTDLINENATTIEQVNANVTVLNTTKANKSVVLTAGNGLDGGGDLSLSRTFDAKKDTGWTASTGTPSKGAYATYAGHTASAGYVQAEAQATDNAVKAASQRLKAVEDALRANESID